MCVCVCVCVCVRVYVCVCVWNSSLSKTDSWTKRISKCKWYLKSKWLAVFLGHCFIRGWFKDKIIYQKAVYTLKGCYFDWDCIYHVFTRMPSDSYCRWFRSVSLCPLLHVRCLSSVLNPIGFYDCGGLVVYRRERSVFHHSVIPTFRPVV